MIKEVDWKYIRIAVVVVTFVVSYLLLGIPVTAGLAMGIVLGWMLNAIGMDLGGLDRTVRRGVHGVMLSVEGVSSAIADQCAEGEEVSAEATETVEEEDKDREPRPESTPEGEAGSESKPEPGF